MSLRSLCSGHVQPRDTVSKLVAVPGVLKTGFSFDEDITDEKCLKA